MTRNRAGRERDEPAHEGCREDRHFPGAKKKGATRVTAPSGPRRGYDDIAGLISTSRRDGCSRSLIHSAFPPKT